MAKTYSTMLPLKTKAPFFALKDVVTDKIYEFNQSASSIATVIMFICNHCPFVKHINKGITELATDYIPRGVRFIAINANDVESYPEDSPENMLAVSNEEHYPFPYLYDETQAVAKAYQAACTPDFFVFDNDLLLVYRGQLDDSRPSNNIPVTGSSIRHALDNTLTNQPVSEEQIPSIGCNIKWK